MRYKFVLDSIFSQKSKIKALRCLVNCGREISIREVAREIKASHPNVSAILTELKSEGIVRSSRVGRSVIYSLNDGHYLVEEIIKPVFVAERMAKKRMFARIKDSINFNFESIILFGSILRGEEKPTSDIDLAVIVKNSENTDEIEQKINALNPIMTKEFGNVLSPIVFKKNDFVKKIKNNNPLVRDIVKNGEIVAGKLINELI